MTDTFKFYKTNDPGGFMSNYYKASFCVYDRWWRTVEHPYQAKKCVSLTDYNAIHQAIKANDARLLGQKVLCFNDWDNRKYKVMEECVLAKFLQHRDLLIQLVETGDSELIEDSPVDYYWGCGADGTGQNNLGKILMKVRDLLKGFNG